MPSTSRSPSISARRCERRRGGPSRHNRGAHLAALAPVRDAPLEGAHAETSLHWAASSNDVAVMDALLSTKPGA
jgi:hypothetical protein